MVFIASHWTPESDLDVPIFSNCDEVELRLNGELMERIGGPPSPATPHLPHSPFSFHLPRFIAGTLEATGLIAGKVCCVHRIATPGAVAKLVLVHDGDEDGDFASVNEPDLLLVHAELRDADGMLCVGETSEVEFSVSDDVCLAGPVRVPAEAGIASSVLFLPRGVRAFTISAFCPQQSILSDCRSVFRGDEAIPESAGTPLVI